MARSTKKTKSSAADSRDPLGASPRSPGSVLMIGSEAVPFAKTGGLADVLGALPLALGRLGWSVTVALPRYRGILAGDLVDRFTVSVGDYTSDIGFYQATLAEGVRALLIECPDLFDRDELYGVGSADFPDNARRFAVLVRATLEWAGRQSSPPSVVHAHDWQAGLAPVYLKTRFASHPVLGGTPSVFTIHNLAYQGTFDPDWLPRLDLPAEVFTADRLEFWGRISLLKGGINDADLITTVSPQYAREVLAPQFGFGFEGVLSRRAADFVGVLNGIDTRVWDPSADPFLPSPYGPDDMSGKAAAKRAVLSRYGLPTDEAAMRRPLIGLISRMVDQKGFDLMASIALELASLDASWVILGKGDPLYQDSWTGHARHHPDRVGVHIGHDEGLAHLIEGGADIFLMPSRFEPCGLNQMYSLRYGTVPVVHGVGGLVDTVHDYSPSDDSSTGFVFREYTAAALMAGLDRALSLFRDTPRWRALQAVGMHEDNSWDRSAREYVNIYERALRTRGDQRPGTGIRDQD